MIKSLFTFLALLFILDSSAQESIELIEMGELPKELDESSGLALASEKTFFTHNDGKKGRIYEIDDRGELLRTVELQVEGLEDLEDMCGDDDGNIFIADIGNNKRERLKLRVLKFHVADIRDDQVVPQAIDFLLPENGLMSKCHYDMEAMIWTRGRLYFFTKDRCDKKDNKLIVYSVPDVPGNYTAKKEGEFFWDEPEKNIKITGADISPDGKKLALLSKNAIHFFHSYKKDQFFNGAYNYLPLPKSQKEAIAHLDSCNLYITEEKDGDENPKLWKINVCKLNFDTY